MTTNLLPLYAASIACIALLAAFARHNRKIGWVKERKMPLQEVIALQESWELLSHEKQIRQKENETAPALPAVTPQEATAFSFQLAKLQSALEEHAVVPLEQPVAH